MPQWINAHRPDAEEDVLSIVLALSRSADRSQTGVLQFGGRIVSIEGLVRAEASLIGKPVEVLYQGPKIERVRLVAGALLRIEIPMRAVHQGIDAMKTNDLEGFRIETNGIAPMREPSARVPLSLLRALQGSDGLTEAGRRAILTVWSQDRVTGTYDAKRRKPLI